jgi:hypothetical protein
MELPFFQAFLHVLWFLRNCNRTTIVNWPASKSLISYTGFRAFREVDSSLYIALQGNQVVMPMSTHIVEPWTAAWSRPRQDRLRLRFECVPAQSRAIWPRQRNNQFKLHISPWATWMMHRPMWLQVSLLLRYTPICPCNIVTLWQANSRDVFSATLRYVQE